MSSYLSHKRKGFQGTASAAFNGFGNRSRSFDGVDDYISIPDNPSLPTGAQTISAWVKTENSGDYADLVSQWDNAGEAGFVILKLQDNQIAFYITNTGSTSGNGSRFTQTGSGYRINVGSWYHVSCVFDPSNSMKIYINGILASTNSNNIHSSIYDSGNDLLIGERADIANRNWHGNIADVRIYDAALTATEISDLYNGTNITTNLVGHWLTDADDTEDKAGSNNGTNYGSKYSYDNPSPPVEFGSASRSFDGDGSSNHVDLGNNASFDLTSTLTMSFWIKPFSSHNGAILSKWTSGLSTVFTNAYSCYFGQDAANERVNFIIQQSNGTKVTLSDSTDLPLSQWSHVVCKADGSNLSVFIDGQSSSSVSYDGTIDVDPVKLLIGKLRQADSIYTFNGKIADVRIYDTDLTTSQISDLYAGTDVTANLVGHWLTDNDDVKDKAGTNDGSNFGSLYDYDAPFTEVTLPNHYWNLSDTGTYADSGKLASAGWDLNEFTSVSSSVQNIGTSTKTVLDTISGGVLEYKNGTNVDVGWDSESKEISIACWFYCTAISNVGNWLISWRGQNNDNRIAQIFIRNDAGLQVFRGSIFDGQGNAISTPQSGTSISLNTWHHGALTWDNTTLKTYINGELFATGTNASVDGLGTNPVDCEFAIGRGAWDKNNSGTDHKGYTFGAGVWDVALTESQIKALYNDGNALDYSETTWR